MSAAVRFSDTLYVKSRRNSRGFVITRLWSQLFQNPPRDSASLELSLEIPGGTHTLNLRLPSTCRRIIFRKIFMNWKSKHLGFQVWISSSHRTRRSHYLAVGLWLTRWFEARTFIFAAINQSTNLQRSGEIYDHCPEQLKYISIMEWFNSTWSHLRTCGAKRTYKLRGDPGEPKAQISSAQDQYGSKPYLRYRLPLFHQCDKPNNQ